MGNRPNHCDWWWKCCIAVDRFCYYQRRGVSRKQVSSVSTFLLNLLSRIVTNRTRSIIFFYAGSATMGAMMCAGPLAYSAMQISPWFCVSVGVTLCALSLPLIFLLPETRQLTAKAAGHLVPEEDCEPSHGSNISWVESARRELPALLRYQFWDNKLLGTCLVVITFTTLGKSMSAILLQYATKRFGWKWEEVRVRYS